MTSRESLISSLVRGSGENNDSLEVIERELVNHFKTFLTKPN